MGFADILGQLVQQGANGSARANDRLSKGVNELDRQGGGMGEIFGQLQRQLGAGATSSTTGAGQGLGGLAEMAKSFLGKEQIGGMSTGQIGGIGAAAGALLGGGVGGAAKGGLMAILGTMALGALKGSQAGTGAGAPAGAGTGQVRELTVEPQEVEELVGENTQKLILKAMISAAKADGAIDQAEMEKIIGRIADGSVTAEEKQFVMDEMRAPLDVNALAVEANSPAKAAEVYAASLLAIDLDTEQEKRYLADLANALRLDRNTVARLHQMTGTPAV
jgi:uncharacterized membrane protein YebE (DUF533 family)